MRALPLCGLFGLALLSLSACSGNVCNDAAAICGAPQEASADQCQGKEEAFAQCIVDAGECSVPTTVDCAKASTSVVPNGSNTGSIGLRIIEVMYPDAATIEVQVQISNNSDPNPLAVAGPLFMLEDTQANLHTGAGICEGGEFLATGGKATCNVQFTLEANRTPSVLRYGDGARSAQTPFPTIACTRGREDTEAACNDGCSNDGDRFSDCDDRDCQYTEVCRAMCASGPENTEAACSDGCSNDEDDFVDCNDFDCGQTMVCGGSSGCTSGPENTVLACSDGCSNDGDRFVDCEDYDCCPVRTDCPAGTACGM